MDLVIMERKLFPKAINFFLGLCQFGFFVCFYISKKTFEKTPCP